LQRADQCEDSNESQEGPGQPAKQSHEFFSLDEVKDKPDDYDNNENRQQHADYAIEVHFYSPFRDSHSTAAALALPAFVNRDQTLFELAQSFNGLASIKSQSASGAG